MKINSAEIICVGTELLLGDIVNTDAAFISARLARLGINQYYQSVVGDNPERLTGVLKMAIGRSDLIIMTGGLGPTYDDLTKETAAKLMGRNLYMHAESLDRIKSRLSSYGREITENNMKQALIPEGSVVFKNNYGTAPGMAIEDEGNNKIIILLPGPPRECEPMFIEEVEPYLSKFSDHIIFSRNVNIFGMGESQVENILRDLMTSSLNPTIAPYAKDGEVLIRVTASGKNEEECRRLCDAAIEKIKASPVGNYIYGIDAGSLENRLVQELTERRLKIASAESCTGGYVSKRITNVSGSSAVLDGSIVAYANEVKQRLLNVSRETLSAYGAVSRETALEMARGVRNLFSSDIGVSTTGIAGPTGGTPEKPVGTVFVGVSTDNFEEVLELHIGNRLATREYVRYIAASNALSLALKAAAKIERK
jgi:nicotinamide-nucleotide amidase